jgi:hypothetical protein
LAFYAVEGLRPNIQALDSNFLATGKAFAELVCLETMKRRASEAETGELGGTIGLGHLLLLDGIDSRDTAHRGLVELHRSCCPRSISDGTREFFDEFDEGISEMIDFGLGIGHG